MSTVYLHIGTMKTGTSAIQSFLAANRELLESQGYAYPEIKIELPRQYIIRNAHFLVCSADEVTGKPVDEKTILENGYAQIEELTKNFENIVLSDEVIWHRSKKEDNFWRDLIDRFNSIGCEVKIIVYLRRQDMAAMSVYNQNVKGGQMTSETFDEYLDGGGADFCQLDYYEQLKKIEKDVCKENIIIRVYENGQFEGEGNTIYSDFLKCIGLAYETAKYEIKNERVNLSLQGNYIELKRIINGLPEYRESDNFMLKPLKAASAFKFENSLHGKESFLTPEKAMAFMSQFETGNRKLAVEFLGREDGILFREPIGSCPVWRMDTETLYEDIMLSMASVFCRQEKQILETKQRIKQLEEQIRHMQKESGLRNTVLRSFRTVKRKIIHK